jgi:hypothetical protein
MKTLLIFAITLLTFFLSAFKVGAADISSAPTTLTDLDTPSFPAGDILGVEPSAIDKPSSARQITASLLNGLSDSGQYGVQIDPYFLSNPVQNKAASKYFNVDGDMFLRNLALSVMKTGISSSGSVTTTNATGTAIGIGIQSLLSFGDLTAFTILQKDVEDQSQLYSDLHFNKISQAEYDAQSTKLQADAVKQENNISMENNVFLKIQPACAFKVDFQNNNLNVCNYDEFAAWINTDFCPAFSDSNKLDAILDLKYVELRQTSLQNSDNNFDVGGRLRFQFGNFAASYEYVGRINSTSNRQDGILEYELNSDAYITGTFGTDFANSTSSTPLLAILGINWGFGDKPSLTNS